MTAKKRLRVSNVKIQQSKQTEHFRRLSSMFPNCNDAYPDCPKNPIDASDNVHEMCAKCPVYMGSSIAKKTVNV